MTGYQQHVARWAGGCGADICAGARRRCFARGTLPCDVLFIGEAPGESENVLGKPFCGPAGHLLDRIIAESLKGVYVDGGTGHEGREPRLAFTNLVCCIPREEGGGKATEPPKEAVKACAPRLKELVRLARPRLVVLVGKLAKKAVAGQADFCEPGEGTQPPWLEEGEFIRFCEITHPAAILRANVAERGLMIQRCEVVLRDAAEEL